MIRRNSVFITVFLLVLCVAFVLTSCGGGGGSDDPGTVGGRTTLKEFPVPEASGDSAFDQNGITVDVSHTDEGYFMVKYSGSAEKIKIQLTGASGNTYTYTDTSKEFETFPVTEGSGSYKLDVLENVNGDMYTLSLSENLDVSLADEYKPFLYPNQYVWYTPDCAAVAKGCELSENSSDDLSFVQNVYLFVTENISYDDAKAANVPLDYVPDIDETLATGKGICFDYASLMSSMLRSQGIPTKLVVGYSGQAYHAWISVWLEETGWVDNIIEFDGTEWSLMDPTLASSNDDSAVKKYIGDGSNYVVKYNY